MFREIKSWLLLGLALVVTPWFVPAASADQSPVDCTGSKPTVEFSKATLDRLAQPIRQGDSIEFGFRVANEGPFACFISNIKVAVRTPNPDGSPGASWAGGNSLGLAGGVSAVGEMGVPPYAVNLKDGVFEAPLEISWNATIRQGDQDISISGQGTGAKFRISRPEATLTVVPDPLAGFAPMVATSTYLLTNTSPASTVDAAAPGILPAGPNGARDLLSDADCQPVTYVSGDNASDLGPVLDPGETWKFTCTRSYTRPGTYSSRPSINGKSTVDGRAWPQIISTDGPSYLRVLGSDLVVNKSHQGDLYAGSSGAYSIRVTNNGNLRTSGTVTVSDQLPEGLTATAVSGTGWDCDLASLSCSREDSLGSGSSFPVVKVTVAVASNPPSTVINRATVTGGGESEAVKTNNSASDPTTIRNPSRPAPSASRFTVGKILTRSNGTVALRVTTAVAGKITVDDARQPDLVERTSRKVPAAGTYLVKVRAGKKLRRQLSRKPNGRKVKLRITFRARGGYKVSLTRRARFRLS